MLTDELIQKEATAATSYLKGCQYFRQGQVTNLQYFPNTNAIRAFVHGGQKYVVHLDFDEHNKCYAYECNCQAYANYSGACKHIIAVMKAVELNWHRIFQNDTEEQPALSLASPSQTHAIPLTTATQEMLNFFYQDTLKSDLAAAEEQAKLIPTYYCEYNGLRKKHYLSFTIGNERMYVVKDIPQLLAAIEHKQQLSYGKKFILTPNTVFYEPYQALLKLLQETYADEQQLTNWHFSSSNSTTFSEKRLFQLNHSNLKRFFQIMQNHSFDIVINNNAITTVNIVETRPQVNLQINTEQDNLKLTMNNEFLYGLDDDCQYIYCHRKIYKVDKEFAQYIKPLIKCFDDNKKNEITLPTILTSDFFSTAYPALKKIGKIEMDNKLIENYYNEQLEKVVYFDRYGEGISARIEFKYGELNLNPAMPLTANNETLHGKVLVRDIVDENKLLNLFRQHNFEVKNNLLVQSNEALAYEFLQHALPELQDIADIFYADDFLRIKPPASVSAGIKLSDNDMLELSLHYEDISPKELMELFSSYKLKKKYHRLKDGSFIPLDTAEFQTMADLMEQLTINETDLAKKAIEIPKYRALYIDSLMRDTPDFHIERSSAFKRMVQDISEPQDMQFTLPAGLQGKLRDYQKTGFKWLKTLASYGLGGILADDMGLGKTLQVITFVLSEKANESKPSLVVAPTSLVYNWQDEVAKFAPSLKVTVISGNQDERLKLRDEITQSDIVITSYGLIKRDLHLYQDVKFKYCILDEAQHIKNPKTLTAKSVKKIQANGYFALTGTPIENTLTELWSIFDFLMPGYLGKHKAFTNNFELPIIKNHDQKALEELGRHIKPFILRRMKKAVLKELPPKIERRMLNEMTVEQAKVYDAWLVQAKQEFESEMKAHGFEKSQIKILSLLTRLRQICCHPTLFIENYVGGSGKMDMLTELLEEAISSGHRVLLFSQFTGMLQLISAHLQNLNISFHYLDGATKAEERIRLVNSFNAGESDAFLISLKAGGTGLNLTGADMVIHYDPWWNPAVEDQATDRAYRIGQKNSVQVCKLITKNTIEEKIYELQQKKREMIDALIKPGENFLTKMSEAEIRSLFDF